LSTLFEEGATKAKESFSPHPTELSSDRGNIPSARLADFQNIHSGVSKVKWGIKFVYHILLLPGWNSSLKLSHAHSSKAQ
jgi:hypothetical protein